MDMGSKKVASSESSGQNYFYSKLVVYGVISTAAVYLSKRLIRKYLDVKNRAYLNNNTNTPSTSIKIDPNPSNKEYHYGKLPERSPSEGKACKFVLKGIDGSPSGMVGGLSSFCCEDYAIDDVSFDNLMGYDNLCLYCIDFTRDLLIFLEISEDCVNIANASDSSGSKAISQSSYWIVGDKGEKIRCCSKGPNPRHKLLTLPFFDRGVRLLAKEALEKEPKDIQYVYVVSFSTAWKYFSTNKRTVLFDSAEEKNDYCQASKVYANPQTSVSASSSISNIIPKVSNIIPNDKCPIFPDEGNVIYIWNTGRCGSTLMHKLLIEMGVASLSEPYWFEQLAMSRWNEELDLDIETIKSYFWLCQNIDFRISNNGLYPASRIYALDPKAFGHWMLPFVVELNPNAKHIFLYRDCISVIESFQSIFFYELPWFQRNYRLIKSYIQNFLFNYKYFTVSERLTTIVKKRYLPLPLPSKPAVARGVMQWVDCMLTIKEFKEKNKFKNKNLLVYRFEEFVKKDISHRKKLLKQLYSFVHAGPTFKEPTDEEIADLLLVFDSHSQKGDRMQNSSSHTGRKYLNWSDKLQICLLLKNIPDIKSSDFIFPGSEFI